MAKKQISVGIVGLGRAGWHLHFEPLRTHGEFRIAAVADPDPARCAEAAGLTGCATFGSLDQMLGATDATLIVVATPSRFHYTDALRVLKSGRDCLLEKPMAITVEEATALADAARTFARRLFVHHQHVHRPEYHHLKTVLKSGVLGPLFHFRAFWGSYTRRWDWQCLVKNGGGQLNNTCPHIFSIVLPLLGSKVTSVDCEMRNIKDVGDAEDHVDMTLRTEASVTANLVVSSAVAVTSPRWMLFGKFGALECNGKTSRLRYYDPEKAQKLTIVDAAPEGRKYLTEELPWVEKQLEVEPPGGVPSFHQNVYDVLSGAGEQLVTPESAVDVMRVLEMARQASIRQPVETAEETPVAG